MIIQDLVDNIKVDLGSDINSLGISDDSIEMKIKQALRKVSSYAPFRAVDSFDVVESKVTMPETTSAVLGIYNHSPSNSPSNNPGDQDIDLFTVRKYIYGNSQGFRDPFVMMQQMNQAQTLKGFVSLKDYMFDRNTRVLYINDFPGSRATVDYLRAYDTLEEVTSEQVVDTIHEYALALCKIIEGEIRRKLQSAPGAISMDGDSLVGEGQTEKASIEAELPGRFSFLRFGIRA